jgi:hypothetical protein
LYKQLPGIVSPPPPARLVHFSAKKEKIKKKEAGVVVDTKIAGV